MLPTASGQASEAGLAVRKAHSEKPPDSQKMNAFIFWPVRRFFFCPEALFAMLKLQAQIACKRSQAGSPAAFFAAFFLRKKARIPLCQFQFANPKGARTHHLQDGEKCALIVYCESS